MSTDLQDANQTKLDTVLQPIFPKATQLLFYTGNTLASFKILKKTNTTITEEILEYISMILQAMRTDFNDKQFQEETYVKLSPVQDENSSAASNGTAAAAAATATGSNTSISPADHEQLAREDLKYSVKIFLRSLEPELLSHTIDTILSELKENYLESVMISLPNYGAHLTLEEFMPLWRVVEDYIEQKKILSAGVCDFMLPLLSDLCDAAKHKPYANQINLGVCCSIPEELNKYVKENNIQLLTHSDPIDVLNDADFQQTIREYCHEYDALNWKPSSIVRYNSVIANRGIIKTKGFFIYAKRDLRMP